MILRVLASPSRSVSTATMQADTPALTVPMTTGTVGALILRVGTMKNMKIQQKHM